MHGVTFGNLHSYDDLSLILSSKKIKAPEPKTETVDIPGGDGVLDFTEFFGDVHYNNRKLSFDFSYIGARSTFMDKFSEVQSALHGRKLKVTLDGDPGYYYVGRCTVDEWKTDKSIGKITVDVDCEPYKYKQGATTVALTAATAEKTVTLTNFGRKTVVPVVVVAAPSGADAASVTLQFDGTSVTLSAGTYTLDNLVLTQGAHELKYSGSGTITIKYQEATL